MRGVPPPLQSRAHRRRSVNVCRVDDEFQVPHLQPGGSKRARCKPLGNGQILRLPTELQEAAAGVRT